MSVSIDLGLESVELRFADFATVQDHAVPQSNGIEALTIECWDFDRAHFRAPIEGRSDAVPDAILMLPPVAELELDIGGSAVDAVQQKLIEQAHGSRPPKRAQVRPTASVLATA